LPVQVFEELGKIARKEKYKFRREAEFALKVLEKSGFKKIDLKEKYVDKGIKKFVEKNKSVILATLDRGLKIPKSRGMVITKKKKIEII
jgi:rRNA-processing protein FCF1